MFGSKLKELRVNYNKQQKELAEYCGISQKAVSRWETDLADPTPENLAKIADFFGISIGELYGIETQASKQVQEKDEVTKLVDHLIAIGIIKDPEDISPEVADMIINAVKIDLQMRKLKQEL